MILRDAIDRYVGWRRAHGARFISSARVLYRFCKRVPDYTCCDAVTEPEVRQFLAGNGPLTRYRANKYGALAGFYRYAISRGYATRSPLPAADEEPRGPPSAPPHIYSRDELKRLFEAIDISRGHASQLDGDTFRTLLLILYGGGLRTSEALHLSMRDVDLVDAVLTGVAPLWWTPEHCAEEVSTCRRNNRRTRRSTGARWSSWFARAARPGSWPASSSAPLRRSATGCVKRIATRAVVRTV